MVQWWLNKKVKMFQKQHNPTAIELNKYWVNLIFTLIIPTTIDICIEQ